ncbi:MAG: glycosyltransferase family A protein [Thermofilum sp.]
MSSKAQLVSILAVIPTLKDDPSEAVRSLLRQTLRPTRIIVVSGSKSLEKAISRKSCCLKVVYVKPELKEHVGVRVGKAINAALAGENLAKYHYLLKLDADVKLHPESLERHVRLGADLVGLGPFMLIKMEKFLSILGGR